MSDLLKWKKGACEAAKIASNLLLSMRQNFAVREKGLYDLVTDAETASQNAIYEHLKKVFPDHEFLGEEDGKGEKDPGPNAPPTWIVDPSMAQPIMCMIFHFMPSLLVFTIEEK